MICAIGFRVRRWVWELAKPISMNHSINPLQQKRTEKKIARDGPAIDQIVLVQLCMQFTIFRKKLLEFHRWVNFDWRIYIYVSPDATACAFLKTNKLSCNHISTIWFDVVAGSKLVQPAFFEHESNQCSDTGWNNMSNESFYLMVKCYFIFSPSAPQHKSTTSAFNIVFIQRCTIFTSHSWFIICPFFCVHIFSWFST